MRYRYIHEVHLRNIVATMSYSYSYEVQGTATLKRNSYTYEAQLYRKTASTSTRYRYF
jgi:hypothetical protein